MEDEGEVPGLICAYMLDGKGGGREVGLKAASPWTPGEGFLWVHLDWRAADAIAWIKENVAEPAVVGISS